MYMDLICEQGVRVMRYYCGKQHFDRIVCSFDRVRVTCILYIIAARAVLLNDCLRAEHEPVKSRARKREPIKSRACQREPMIGQEQEARALIGQEIPTGANQNTECVYDSQWGDFIFLSANEKA